MHNSMLKCQQGQMSDGWGEVSQWPVELVESGDWTPAVWRTGELAEAAVRLANDSNLQPLEKDGRLPQATGRPLRGSHEPGEADTPGGFAVLKSSGSDGQTRIQSQPDEHWIPKNFNEEVRELNDGTYSAVDRILRRAGYLLISAAQRNTTARLTAVAINEKYVGNSWMPVTGLSSREAKATAVFINSTAGRL